ncbi:MAG TPA: hypothetical protein VH044_13505 [Polyangiaceae bacterium]|jgi:hypothetical protein|nr:hypothetical protein [Polyangiaceae bacterium]
MALVAASGCGSSGGGSTSAAADGGSPFIIEEAGTFYGDAGADSEIAYSVTLVSDVFTVGAGKEVYKCQDFANPFNGQQVDILKHESHMAVGSHHILFFFKQGATDGALEDCTGLEAYPFQYVAQSRDFSMTYPEGVGATIPTSIGFRMNMHYLNTGSTPIQAQDRVTMYVAKSGVVTQHAGTIFFQQVSIDIPTGGQPYTSTRTCNVSQDINLLSADSHMHQRATDFTATAAGMTLYQTNAWSDPTLSVYAPPIHLASGTPLTWSCTYVNDTGSDLGFGESAQTNAMCIYQGTFYPVADVTNPIMNCVQ